VKLKAEVLEAFRKDIPHDRGELFVGYSPLRDDAEGWKRTVAEAATEGEAGWPLARTVWDNPENAGERVLVDVIECNSASEALDALAETLEWNQLAEMEQGPIGPGLVAFMHPDGVPPAIFFARGNLCIRVVSYANVAAPVIAWAEGVNRRLDEKPTVERRVIKLTAGKPAGKGEPSVTIDYELPWRYGEEGYLKFVAKGGALARQDGRLVVTGPAGQEVTVDAYLLESGREPQTGQIVVTPE